MGIIRDSFVIYRDWAEGISELSPKNRLACYDALMQFGLTGQFPEDIKNETVRAILFCISLLNVFNIALTVSFFISSGN